MNRIPSLLALMLGTLAAACAAPGAHRLEPANTDFVYIGTAVGDFRVERHQDRSVRSDKIEAAPMDVFATLPSIYNDLGIEVGTVDQAGLVFGNTEHRASRNIAGVRMSRFFECGRSRDTGGNVADVAPLNLSILTRVEPDGPDRSRVTTTVSASARATHGATGGQTACSTTGILEGLIAAIAADRVVASRHGGGSPE